MAVGDGATAQKVVLSKNHCVGLIIDGLNGTAVGVLTQNNVAAGINQIPSLLTPLRYTIAFNKFSLLRVALSARQVSEVIRGSRQARVNQWEHRHMFFAPVSF